MTPRTLVAKPARKAADFRELCHHHGLAATHQRAVIYDAIMQTHGHPSPEDIFERVRQQVPSMSLATVYKTIHAFIDAGIIHEVSLHSGTLRVDGNSEPHHHVVCTKCRAIFDVDDESIGPLSVRGRVPKGFKVQRLSLEIQGLCEHCAAKSSTHQ